MAKLDKNVYPNNSSPDDFQCFGPPATEDGQFDKCKIADLGCFTQDGKDSNKMYHAAVVQHKKTKGWYTYYQWGRTGGSTTFQFEEYSSESEAQRAFAKQLHEKNDKRGQWVTIAGIKTLQAKPNKDCYLVRPMATRSTGLPDAKTIKINEGAKVTAAPTVTSSKPKSKVDIQTLHLMKDLNIATVSYTRGVMADASLPTQKSLDDARQILQEAQKRLIVTGDNVDQQVADKELNELTRLMYSRIPKKKALHCDPKEWILNKDNIFSWTADIDAFESALSTVEHESDSDPLGGMPANISWIDPTTSLGKFLHKWWPSASANRHHHVGKMKIKNLWKIDRHGDDTRFIKEQDKILNSMPKNWNNERPLFQPKERNDTLSDFEKYHNSNTALLFHGSRSVNCSGIMREHFRLPKQLVGVVITGAMFGAWATYLADDWRKSDGYTSRQGSYWSSGNGAVKGRGAFMFACDAVLGHPYVAPGPKGFTGAPHGYHSLFGKAGFSQVQNNEWLAVPNQIVIRYLCEYDCD